MWSHGTWSLTQVCLDSQICVCWRPCAPTVRITCLMNTFLCLKEVVIYATHKLYGLPTATVHSNLEWRQNSKVNMVKTDSTTLWCQRFIIHMPSLQFEVWAAVRIARWAVMTWVWVFNTSRVVCEPVSWSQHFTQHRHEGQWQSDWQMTTWCLGVKWTVYNTQTITNNVIPSSTRYPTSIKISRTQPPNNRSRRDLSMNHSPKSMRSACSGPSCLHKCHNAWFSGLLTPHSWAIIAL